jgi:4-amino-4-deoxy-L-arabinose transferase-like glycosyltransferase
MSIEASSSAGRRRTAWLGLLGLAILVGGLFFFRLGDDVPLRSHEALLAGTARNMFLNRPVQLADGSRPSPYLVPNFNDSPRLRKTPLAYWMVVPVACVLGEVNAWSARLPSAVAALITVLLMAAVLWRQYDRLTALLGAAALATTVGFLINARAALADMPMTCFSTASLVALWFGAERSGARRFGWFIAAGACGGLAMLAKGPVPLLVLPLPYLVAAVFMVARLVRARGGGRAAIGDWLWTLGGAAAAIVVFLAIVLPWPAYVYLHVPQALDIWRAESVDRSVGDFGHQEPIYFYLLRLPVLLAPWTVFFIYGLVMAVRRAWRRAVDWAWLCYAGAWVVGPLVGLSLAAGKQDHYALPLMPAMTIFTALAMRKLLAPLASLPGAAEEAPAAPPGGPADGATPGPDAEPAALARTGQWLTIAHGVFFVAVGVVGVAAYGFSVGNPFFYFGLGVIERLATPAILRPLAVLGAVFIVGGVAASVLAARGRSVGGLAVLLAMFAAGFLWSGPTLIGPLDRASRAAEFARQVRQVVPEDAPLYGYRGAGNSVIFYLARPIPVLGDAASLRQKVLAGRTTYVITEDRYLPHLPTDVNLLRVLHVADPYRPGEGLWLLKAAGRSP